MMKMKTKKLGMLTLALVILPLAGCGGEVVKEVEHEAPIQEYTLVVKKCPKTDFPEMPDWAYAPVSLSQLAGFMPAAPPGWTIDRDEIVMERHVRRVYTYYRDGVGIRSIYVRIGIGYLSHYSEMLEYELYYQLGYEPTSIKGYPALVKYSEAGGFLKIFVCGRGMVSLNGSHRDDVYTFADRIDFDGIVAYAMLWFEHEIGIPGDTIENGIPEDTIENGIPEDTVELDELVTTDEHTRKKITIPDVGEVIVNVNSEVKFESPTILSIFKGELLLRARELKRRGYSFEVRMPQAIMGVRGTEFLVNVEEDGTTTLTVLEGTVEFSDLNKTETVLVGKNQRSVVEPGGLPAEPVSIDVKLIPIWWE